MDRRLKSLEARYIGQLDAEVRRLVLINARAEAELSLADWLVLAEMGEEPTTEAELAVYDRLDGLVASLGGAVLEERLIREYGEELVTSRALVVYGRLWDSLSRKARTGAALTDDEGVVAEVGRSRAELYRRCSEAELDALYATPKGEFTLYMRHLATKYGML